MWRWGISLGALGFALALTATPVWAQNAPGDPPPPVVQNVDANGVDVTSGAFVLSDVQAATGPKSGPGQLARVFSNMPSRDNLYGAINANGSTYTVSVAGSSETFTSSGGIFTSQQARGSTLTGPVNGIYTYTASDGTVAKFDSTYSGSVATQANVGRIVQLISPTGEVIYYSYQLIDRAVAGPTKESTFWFYRFQQVDNNRGLQIRYSYAADYGNKGDYITAKTLTKVQSLNNATQWCSQSGCSLGGAVTFSGTSATDALGRTTSYGTPAPNTAQTITRPSGSSLRVSYDGSSRVSLISNGAGTWSYGYAISGSTLTVTVTDPNNSKKTYTANTANSTLTSYVDALGRKTSYAYDGYGRLTSLTHPHGDVITYTYDENETSARGDVTTTTWAPAGGGAAIVTHAGFDASCSYPAKCNKPNWTRDARGNQTDYAYDNATGVTLTITKPAGANGVRPQARYGYTWLAANFKNASGATVQGASIYLPTSTSSCRTQSSCSGTADETRIAVTYDPNQNLAPVSITTSSGDGSISSTQAYSYDGVGNLLTSTSPLGAVTRYRYDADRELIGVTGADPDGSGAQVPTATKLDYDGGGRLAYVRKGTVASQSDADWAGFSEAFYAFYGYDPQDRHVLTFVGPTGQAATSATQYSYDAASRLTCTAVRMNASQFGSLPSSACTLGSPLRSGPDQINYYYYDAADVLAQVTSGYGTPQSHISQRHSYNTDGTLGIDLDGKTNATCYGYDGFGRVAQTTYEAPGTSGSCNGSDYEQYAHDNNGNVVAMRKRDGSTYGFSYDALNNMTSGIDGDTYAYDNYGHLISAARTSGGATSVGFSYDALGRMSSSTRSGIGGAIGYQYNAAGDRVRLTWPDGFWVGYNYDILGRPTSTLEGGVSTGQNVIATYGYNSLSQLVSETRAGQKIYIGLSYDGVGRPSNISYSYPNAAYNTYLQLRYDEANRISWKQFTNGAIYDWAPSAGEVHINYGIDGLNRITSAGGGGFGYDAKGDLTSDSVNSYRYNSHNWMTGANSASLNYDALGRLYALTSGSATTQFLYDGSDLIAEYDGSGNLLRRFIHGQGTDAVVGWYEGGSRRYLIPDTQGSIIAAVDASGAPVGFNTYDEFGLPGNANIGRFQYTGQAWIPELGLYDDKARMYSPGLGRFLQTDPAGYADGMNWYAYTHGDPVNGTDPSGTTNCGGYATYGPGGVTQTNYRCNNTDNYEYLRNIAGAYHIERISNLERLDRLQGEKRASQSGQPKPASNKTQCPAGPLASFAKGAIQFGGNVQAAGDLTAVAGTGVASLGAVALQPEVVASGGVGIILGKAVSAGGFGLQVLGGAYLYFAGDPVPLTATLAGQAVSGVLPPALPGNDPAGTVGGAVANHAYPNAPNC